MESRELIYRRKSVRSYTGVAVDEETLRKIRNFANDAKPLYPDIKVRFEIMERRQIRCLCPWTTPQVISVFSEEKEGFLENVGFIFQQLELYMVSLGLGVCWLGMGRLKGKDVLMKEENDGLQFVIMLAFGHPKGEYLRADTAEFRRRSPDSISDREDLRLEPARLAPSSVNSQPWYFTHEGDVIHAHCVKQGRTRMKPMGEMNRIDMGIALAHLYVENPDTFSFLKKDNLSSPEGYGYIGSFTL